MQMRYAYKEGWDRHTNTTGHSLCDTLPGCETDASRKTTRHPSHGCKVPSYRRILHEHQRKDAPIGMIWVEDL